jgi:glyoxylase-like metal-dependent hydrolase (beta-lactamase superfamily II)
MKRQLVLGGVIVIGALAMLGAAQQTQPQPGGAAANSNQPKVIDVLKVADDLYMFVGGGANTAVFVTANGVVVVDTKNPGWGQVILDKIKTITPRPVTMIIDTHVHGDHTSGQVEFPASVDIVAQEQTSVNMRKTGPPWDARMAIYQQGNNRSMLPKRTFQTEMTIGAGRDRIDLFYFGRGHTNGDAWVVFPAQRVLHSADMFPGKTVPRIDPDNGGTAVEYAGTLDRAVGRLSGVDRIITGHSNTLMAWDDLKEYVTFNRELLAWARSQFVAGKSVDAAADEYRIPDKYKDYRIMYPAKQYLQAAFDEWKKSPAQ